MFQKFCMLLLENTLFESILMCEPKIVLLRGIALISLWNWVFLEPKSFNCIIVKPHCLNSHYSRTPCVCKCNMYNEIILVLANTFNSSVPEIKIACFEPSQNLTTGPYFCCNLWNDRKIIGSPLRIWCILPMIGRGSGPKMS